ncbi:MAG TPA: hypothetical protein VN695_10145 [Streptosporangiaceae bacterium]|nr:hypothetical protein [Streptosporangiaceae bacterium]
METDAEEDVHGRAGWTLAREEPWHRGSQVARLSSTTSSLVSWVILLTSIPKSSTSAPPDPQVQEHGLIGETAVELTNMVALREQALRFLARGKRHVQVTSQAAAVQARGSLDHFSLPLARTGACASALPAADRSAPVALGSPRTLAASDAATAPVIRRFLVMPSPPPVSLDLRRGA